MEDRSGEPIRRSVEAVYRSESRRVFATLIRLLGDFDCAEEAMDEAFAAAVEQWPRAGVPSNPRAWLVSTGRFKAIDALRRRARLDATLAELAARLDRVENPTEEDCGDGVVDDRLRLIFTCCHPALPPTTQVALTLREVCGLTTEEIAGAFLSAPSAIAQRLVRGKAKIRGARIPYQVPPLADLPESVRLIRDRDEKGQSRGASPLHPVSLATSARVRDGKRLVTDGPFAETREQLGGYLLIEAQHLDEAIGIAGRVPAARKGTVEIRPVLEIAGLPAAESFS